MEAATSLTVTSRNRGWRDWHPGRRGPVFVAPALGVGAGGWPDLLVRSLVASGHSSHHLLGLSTHVQLEELERRQLAQCRSQLTATANPRSRHEP